MCDRPYLGGFPVLHCGELDMLAKELFWVLVIKLALIFWLGHTLFGHAAKPSPDHFAEHVYAIPEGSTP